MLRVKDVLPARDALVEGDWHIPLVVEWPMGRRGFSFSIGLEGTDGGEIELDVDEIGGSLRRFVVLIAPPQDESLTEPSAPSIDGHLVIDPSHYEDALPDYMKVTFGARLRWRDLGDRYLLQMFPEPVVRYVTSGDVRIGLADGDLLATLSAPKPDLERGLSI